MTIIERTKIDSFINVTGADMETARAYLESEEWLLSDAVHSYFADFH